MAVVALYVPLDAHGTHTAVLGRRDAVSEPAGCLSILAGIHVLASAPTSSYDAYVAATYPTALPTFHFIGVRISFVLVDAPQPTCRIGVDAVMVCTRAMLVATRKLTSIIGVVTDRSTSFYSHQFPKLTSLIAATVTGPSISAIDLRYGETAIQDYEVDNVDFNGPRTAHTRLSGGGSMRDIYTTSLSWDVGTNGRASS